MGSKVYNKLLVSLSSTYLNSGHLLLAHQQTHRRKSPHCWNCTWSWWCHVGAWYTAWHIEDLVEELYPMLAAPLPHKVVQTTGLGGSISWCVQYWIAKLCTTCPQIGTSTSNLRCGRVKKTFFFTHSVGDMKEYLVITGTKKRKIREGHERSPLLLATPFVEHFLQIPSLASIKSFM